MCGVFAAEYLFDLKMIKMIRSISITIAFILLCPAAQAGVTIHFEGTASSSSAIAQIIAIATAFAKKRGWQIKDASAKTGKIPRVIEEKDKDDEGKITGVVLYPPKMCEPVYLQFGDDLFMQDYVKTQFSGVTIHLEVIALFDELKPHFKKLSVDDEGEYWETRNKKTLENHIDTVNRMIKDIRTKNPKAEGPIKLPSGRIADVIN